MERVISIDERIKRAEEIYNRRKYGQNTDNLIINKGCATKKVNFYFLKKTLLKLLICAVIYLIFYLLQNNNYIFSDSVLKKTREILQYNINLTEIYEKSKKYLNNISNYIDLRLKNENDNYRNDIEENQVAEVILNEMIEVNNIQQEKIAKTQEQIDVEYIKSRFNIVTPLNGIITSRYGEREETEIISGDHKGLDIGANQGELILAAMDGNVILASYASDYGNYIKIQNKNVITLYAHCKKIYVKEGEKIKQGEKIAEVGNTGKATGPHLHFEIRIDERFINPELIINI